jgi:hypothetical protein
MLVLVSLTMQQLVLDVALCYVFVRGKHQCIVAGRKPDGGRLKSFLTIMDHRCQVVVDGRVPDGGRLEYVFNQIARPCGCSASTTPLVHQCHTLYSSCIHQTPYTNTVFIQGHTIYTSWTYHIPYTNTMHNTPYTTSVPERPNVIWVMSLSKLCLYTKGRTLYTSCVHHVPCSHTMYQSLVFYMGHELVEMMLLHQGYTLYTSCIHHTLYSTPCTVHMHHTPLVY